MTIEEALRQLRADKPYIAMHPVDSAAPRPKHNDIQTGPYNWQDHTCEIN